jgi:pimeloyl-ACP methyl ester carboxylesterase
MVKLRPIIFVLSWPLALVAVSSVCYWDPRALAVLLCVAAVTAVRVVFRAQGGIDVLRTQVTGDPKGETLFFIHGWPDNAGMWDAQVQHLSEKGYRCVTLTLPHFSGRGDPDGSAVPWGYTFEELAQMCGRTLKQSLQAAGQESATLVIHDWGCYVGFYVQRLHPELVGRIVAMDVGSPPMRGQSASFAPVLMLAGCAYQYWLATAFVVGNAVPFVGPLLGDAMTRYAIAAIGDKHHRSTAAQAGFSASMNYLYFWFHVNYWLEILGARQPFHERFPHTAAMHDESRPPTLFFYGNDKGFKFHGERWVSLHSHPSP